MMSFPKKVGSFLRKRDTQAVLGTLIGSSIEAMGVVWILNVGNFFATGITGISQVLFKFIHLLSGGNVLISVGILYFVLNIPLLIIGATGVSKRFAIFSMVSVALQSGLIVLFELIQSKTGFSPFSVFANDRLLLAIIGGLLGGISSGVMLRTGSSAGGIEILSQYLYFKKHANFARASLIINICILITGFLVVNAENEDGLAAICYTAIRLILYVLVMDRVNTIYKYTKLSIVTTEPEKMRDEFIGHFNHGLTIYKVTGGYSLQEKTVLEVIVSNYEAEKYQKIAHEIDPGVFISVSQISKVDGRFNQNRIA